MPEIAFTQQIRVPATHPCLPGHFPQRPIVPAVLLLERVAAALRERFGAVRVTRVASAKFLRPVLPGQDIEISLNADDAAGRVRFRISVGQRLAAHGELSYVRA